MLATGTLNIHMKKLFNPTHLVIKDTYRTLNLNVA